MQALIATTPATSIEDTLASYRRLSSQRLRAIVDATTASPMARELAAEVLSER